MHYADLYDAGVRPVLIVFIGRVDAETLRDVIRAIGYVIAAECEPG